MTPTLLVLTDFAQPANRALAYAGTLAQAIGATLVLLHVHRDALLDPDRFTGELDELNAEVTDRALASLVRGLPVPAVAEVGHGQVADAVAAAVQRHRPLLLVAGRTAAEGTPDELASATALALVRHLPYPLLVVPDTGHPLPVPHRILLAVDGETFSLGNHAGPVRRLLDALPAELTVLTVTDDETAPAAAAHVAAAALASVQRTGLLADLTAPAHARAAVAERPAAGILRLATPADFDIVALIARPRSVLGGLFHRSVTAQVLLHSALPVLALPAE